MFTLREHVNMMNKERKILQSALDALRVNEVGESLNLAYGPAGDDASVTLRLMGTTEAHFCAEVKSIDRVQSLRLLQPPAPDYLLVTPYLSPELAGECRRLGLNFIDTAGNAYLNVPGQLIWISGRPRPKTGVVLKEQGALRTANGLRIVFALLIRQELIKQPMREIAAQAGVALGSVGAILEALQAMGHVSAGKGAARRLLDVEGLQRAWVQHYPVSLRHKLHPQRYTALKGWSGLDALDPSQAVWGGEVAAHRMDGYLQPAEATLYNWASRQELMKKHRLKPDANGDIEILDAFWTPLEAADGALAPALLVYADLMASRDGRSREAAAKVWEQMPHA